MNDDELRDLLEGSAERSVAAVDELRHDVAALRHVFDTDREDMTARIRTLDRRVERYGKDLGDLRTELERVDKKCGALVIEETDQDGETTVTAKSAAIGIDIKTAIGLFTAFCAATVTPIVVAILTQGGS